MARNMAELPEREAMEFDVVIVGAGPRALRRPSGLKQLAARAERELSVVVLEKGSEVGAHILSGAVIDPSASTASSRTGADPAPRHDAR